MPIPRIPVNGWSSEEELFEAYKEHNWSRGFEFSWISMDARLGGCIEEKYIVDANRITCRCEGQNKFTFVLFAPTGLITTCGSCRRTTGNIDLEDPCIKLISKRRIPISEAFAIMDRTKQYIPATMKQLRGVVDPLRNIR